MLLQSVLHGLTIFTHWEAYFVALIVTVIVAFPKLFLALYIDKHLYGVTPFNFTIFRYLIRHHWVDRFEALINRCTDGSIIRNFKIFILIDILEFIGCYYGVFTLMFLVLGHDHAANWGGPFIMPFVEPLVFFKILGVSLIAIMLVGQIPIIGDSLISPAIACVLAKQCGISQSYEIPGFWMTLGIVGSGVAIKYLVILLVGVFAAFTPYKIKNSWIGGFGRIIFFLLLPLGNLMPVFIYFGWFDLL